MSKSEEAKLTDIIDKRPKRPKMLVPSIENFIDFNKDVGTTYMYVKGYPGSGKSYSANIIVAWCLKFKNAVFMRGSAACEWRHFINYPKSCQKITVLIPKGYKNHIAFKLMPNSVIEEIIEVDYHKLNVVDYIKPQTILVLYDECFGEPQKAWLMVDQLKNIMYRTNDDIYRVPIVYLEHEAGQLFPMNPVAPKKENLSNKHWHAVNEMSRIIVNFRKYFVRPIFISQIEGQFNHLIKDLCTWKLIRQGEADGREHKSIRKSSGFLQIDEYTIAIGRQLFQAGKKITGFNEIKAQWMMIPKKMIKYICEQERNEPKKEKKAGVHLTPREAWILRERAGLDIIPDEKSFRKIARKGNKLYNLSRNHNVYIEAYYKALDKLDEKISKLNLLMVGRYVGEGDSIHKATTEVEEVSQV